MSEELVQSIAEVCRRELDSLLADYAGDFYLKEEPSDDDIAILRFIEHWRRNLQDPRSANEERCVTMAKAVVELLKETGAI